MSLRNQIKPKTRVLGGKMSKEEKKKAYETPSAHPKQTPQKNRSQNDRLNLPHCILVDAATVSFSFKHF